MRHIFPDDSATSMRALVWGLGARVLWFSLAGVLAATVDIAGADGIGQGMPDSGFNHVDAEAQSTVFIREEHDDSASSELVEDDGTYSVARRFRLMVMADHKKDGRACERDMVLQAADITRLRVGGSRTSFSAGLVPLVGLPLLAAAGLKDYILGVNGPVDELRLPGARALTPHDVVDGVVSVGPGPPPRPDGETPRIVPFGGTQDTPFWKSKTFIGSGVALVAAIIAGLASSYRASKQERSRRGLLGGEQTAVWDLSDCILLVDVGQAQSRKSIFGTFVPGSARLIVDYRRQRARLLYEERPPLVGNLLFRLRRKSLNRFEDFQLNTPHCYFRPDFQPLAQKERTEVSTKKEDRHAPLPLTSGNLFFRELLDSKGKKTEGIAIHFVKNPGWVAPKEALPLAAAARSAASDLDFTLLMRRAAARNLVCSESVKGGSGGISMCWKSSPPTGSLLLWHEEVLQHSCRVVAAFRGSVNHSVWANFATQQLSIGSDAPSTRSDNVRSVLSKCLLLERNPPTYGVALKRATISCPDPATVPCGSILFRQKTDVGVLEGHSGASTSSRKPTEVASTVLQGKEEPGLVGAGAATQMDYRRNKETSKVIQSSVEFFTVFIVDFQRKPSDWPVLLEMRKKDAARTRT
ncbi:putative transmembrane protein [Toxoplasma gondii TgCatPRC2]|uniref:Putative transmembrane protein n=1 Tax=Toxoplasma gondii TgCatPRC2 TaxID=1130821 RepID=A0A151H317_TOXGO|nr:putative transmembrane protein [Toxoplasma gondii TgCatPRC2]